MSSIARNTSNGVTPSGPTRAQFFGTAMALSVVFDATVQKPLPIGYEYDKNGQLRGPNGVSVRRKEARKLGISKRYPNSLNNPWNNQDIRGGTSSSRIRKEAPKLDESMGTANSLDTHQHIRGGAPIPDKTESLTRESRTAYTCELAEGTGGTCNVGSDVSRLKYVGTIDVSYFQSGTVVQSTSNNLIWLDKENGNIVVTDNVKVGTYPFELYNASNTQIGTAVITVDSTEITTTAGTTIGTPTDPTDSPSPTSPTSLSLNDLHLSTDIPNITANGQTITMPLQVLNAQGNVVPDTNWIYDAKLTVSGQEPTSNGNYELPSSITIGTDALVKLNLDNDGHAQIVVSNAYALDVPVTIDLVINGKKIDEFIIYPQNIPTQVTTGVDPTTQGNTTTATYQTHTGHDTKSVTDETHGTEEPSQIPHPLAPLKNLGIKNPMWWKETIHLTIEDRSTNTTTDQIYADFGGRRSYDETQLDQLLDNMVEIGEIEASQKNDYHKKIVEEAKRNTSLAAAGAGVAIAAGGIASAYKYNKGHKKDLPVHIEKTIAINETTEIRVPKKPLQSVTVNDTAISNTKEKSMWTYKKGKLTIHGFPKNLGGKQVVFKFGTDQDVENGTLTKVTFRITPKDIKMSRKPGNYSKNNPKTINQNPGFERLTFTKQDSEIEIEDDDELENLFEYNSGQFTLKEISEKYSGGILKFEFENGQKLIINVEKVSKKASVGGSSKFENGQKLITNVEEASKKASVGGRSNGKREEIGTGEESSAEYTPRSDAKSASASGSSEVESTKEDEKKNEIEEKRSAEDGPQGSDAESASASGANGQASKDEKGAGVNNVSETKTQTLVRERRVGDNSHLDAIPVIGTPTLMSVQIGKTLIEDKAFKETLYKYDTENENGSLQILVIPSKYDKTKFANNKLTFTFDDGQKVEVTVKKAARVETPSAKKGWFPWRRKSPVAADATATHPNPGEASGEPGSELHSAGDGVGSSSKGSGKASVEDSEEGSGEGSEKASVEDSEEGSDDE